MQHEPRVTTGSGLSKTVGRLLAASAVAMLIVSIGFRCRSLDNIPGVNGDEAWYGLRAMEILQGHAWNVVTPTGNVPNPLFLCPLVLLHLALRPAIWVLRSVSLASGLAALAVNFWLCRRVFDRLTAVISTLCLAVLPVNIAYSRFAWDASQSLLVTLPVLYLALAALRFPAQRGRLLPAAIAAQVWAFLVHPTNIFVAPVIAAAGLASISWGNVRNTGLRGLLPRRVPYLAICITGLLVVLAGLWLHTPASPRATSRLTSLNKLLDFRGMSQCAALYPRLIAGDTVYRYIAGSDSWLRWPARHESNRVGVDVLLVWGALLGAAWRLRPWRRGEDSRVDGALLAAWAMTLAGFVLVANVPGIRPGYERMAICLVAPTVLVLARGTRRFVADAPRRSAAVLFAASLLGWLLLADFQAHYFRFIERTGGESHATFRTAQVDPKSAALAAVLRERGPGETWIVSSQWWICCPLGYLAAAEPGVHVLSTLDAVNDLPPRALAEGRVWYVEFCGTRELAEVESRLSQQSISREDFADFSGRPVVRLVHVR
jgi:hypothetical protein